MKLTGQKAQAAIKEAIKAKEQEIVKFCHDNSHVMLPYLRLLKEKRELEDRQHKVMMGMVDQILYPKK